MKVKIRTLDLRTMPLILEIMTSCWIDFSFMAEIGFRKMWTLISRILFIFNALEHL